MKEKLQQIAYLMSEIPDLNNSIIHKVILTMLAGEFSEITEEHDQINKKIVGEMNDLEKAAQTLREVYSATQQELAKSLRTDKPGPEAQRAIIFKFNEANSRFEAADQILLSSFQGRIKGPEIIDNCGFYMCTGGKIAIAVCANSEEDDSFIQAARQLRLKTNFS